MTGVNLELEEGFCHIPEKDTTKTVLWVCCKDGEVKVSKTQPTTATDSWIEVTGPDELSKYMTQNGLSELNISTEELDDEQTQMLLQGLKNITCGNINLKTKARQLDAKMVCADNVNIEGTFDVVNLPKTARKCTINSPNVSKVYFGKNPDGVDELIVQNSKAKKMVIKNNVHAKKIVLLK